MLEPITPINRRGPFTVLSIGTAIMIGLLAWLLSNGLLARLELAASDVLFRIRPPAEGASPVVIVAIDDDSFAANGLQWPWPRDYIATIVDNISAGNPAVIAVDVFFYEPSDPVADSALAQSLAAAGNVILVNDITFETESGFTSQKLNRPIPELEAAATSLGLVNFPRDADGTVRRLLAYQEHDQQIYFGWSLQAARLYLGQREFTGASPSVVLLGESPVRLNNSLLTVNYDGPAASIPYYSAYQVAEGTLDPAVFANKIVIIGATSETLHDTYPTPFGSDPPMPGAEINAQAINTILGGNFIYSVRIGFALTLLASLAAMLLVLRLRPLIGLAALGAISFTYLIAAIISFNRAGILLPIVAPLLAQILSFIFGTSIQLYDEQRQRQQVRSLFDRYVAPAVIDQMLSQPDSIKPGGQRREISVLFSDIRGFTSLSEQLDPAQVVSILNEYLTEMTDIVFKYQGMVDKFEGDAILAVFNAPLDVHDHAAQAVLCAVEMLQRLETLQELWTSLTQKSLEIGIGINSGEAFVGNIGSTRRMEYTVIGDTVNLASRLQDLTKELSMPILFSKATADSMLQEIPTYFVTSAKVKGRVAPVEVFTFGNSGPPPAELVE